MPIRGGRVGGGSRGGGFRAPRSSSGGAKGFRINMSHHSPRVTSSAPNTNSSLPEHSHHVHHRRPWFRRGDSDSGGSIWQTIGIILGLFFLGMCTCAGLGLILQALGYGL